MYKYTLFPQLIIQCYLCHEKVHVVVSSQVTEILLHYAYMYLYLPLAVFIAQLLFRPSKQLKQIIQTEHNVVKNPSWQEASQLAIYKHGRGFELGATMK